MFVGGVAVHVPLRGLQGDPQQVRTVGQRAIKVLESRQPEGHSLTHLLPVVSKVASLAPDALPEGQHTPVSGGPGPRKPAHSTPSPWCPPQSRPRRSASGWGTGSATPASSKGRPTPPGASSPRPEPGRSVSGVGHLRAAVCSSCGSAALFQDGPSCLHAGIAGVVPGPRPRDAVRSLRSGGDRQQGHVVSPSAHVLASYEGTLALPRPLTFLVPCSLALSPRWTGPWPQTSSQCCPRASASRRTSG